MRSAITRHTMFFVNKARWILSARWFMICALACLALTACTVGIVRQEALLPATGVSPTPAPDFVSSTTTPEPIPTATSTIPPTAQVTLPAAPSATPNPSTSVTWNTYRNDAYGFTFEYPAIYDETSYKDSCGIKESNDGIHLGHQIDVLFLESNGLTLTDYASSLLQSKGWTLDSLTNVTINDLNAVTVEYRFGGTNRYGTFTLIEDNAHVLLLNFSAGSFCNILEAQISEPAAYAHILETFRLTP